MRIRPALLVCSICLIASPYLFGAEDAVKVDNNVVRITEVASPFHVTRNMPQPKTNSVMVSLGAANIQLIYAQMGTGAAST